jgi:hypothetical protein
MTTKTPTLDEQFAAAQAEANRLRAEKDRIDGAGIAARDEARLARYKNDATVRAGGYRENRDALHTKLTELAAAENLDLNALFTAYVEMRDADSKAGALNTHASMLNSLEPEPRNAFGA